MYGSMPDNQKDSHTVANCMEVWGGNGTTENHFTRPGLDIWISSQSKNCVEAEGSEGEISIRAEQGAVDLEEDSFRLIGRVKGRVGAGQRFETSEVRYDSSTEKIWTDREVRVVQDNLTLVGKGMDLDLKERRVQILNGVRTTLEGEDPS